MLFGLLKSVKFWVILGAVMAVLAFAKWAVGAIHDAGYNEAELEWQQATQKLIDEVIEETRRMDAIAFEAAMANIETEVEIIDGKARIVKSPCSKKLCIKSGYIQYADRFAACLPNRVVVRVIGAPHRGIDAVLS